MNAATCFYFSLFLFSMIHLSFESLAQLKPDKVVRFEELADGLYGITEKGERIKIFDKGKDKVKEILADVNEFSTDLKKTTRYFVIGSGVMVAGAVMTTSGMLISDKLKVDTTGYYTVNTLEIPITTTESVTATSKKVLVSMGVITGLAGLGLNAYGFHRLVNHMKKVTGIKVGKASILDWELGAGYAAVRLQF